ncbi:hypothetical protein SAMN04488105_102389 [Salipiger thiooxidans]|uniref:Glycosyltransferase sugar-binding region containing DXD motif-containing protein n=1 Tax=Salipiger thiooxidans TaxID=282683 RepID=A0A1G7BW49_9RHOB|nr:hypothetical protein [Salipiger thiooxidans]SDE30606.1 hypothetical protein SAMN04488105_102389 [Salipiger thiooxidans]
MPRRIVQYWNRTEVPDSIRAIMESWRAVPGWHDTLFDRGSALRWLRDTDCTEHVRAFKLASHVAEESDFLLMADGGIYADADDLLTGPQEALLQHGAGLVVFPEPTLGSIENNLLCAPRGHPVIARAVDLSLRAMLGRDNAKTGPGMLTRATALHLIEDPGAALVDTHLLPRAFLHRQVHPHMALPCKSTSHYWNAQTGEVSHAVHTALTKVVGDREAPPRRDALSAWGDRLGWRAVVRGRSDGFGSALPGEARQKGVLARNFTPMPLSG